MPKPPKRSSTVKPTAAVEREILYPKIRTQVKEIDAEYAKKLLGWEEETDVVKFGQDYLLVDRNGVKVRCHNNSKNRPYVATLAKAWTSEILRGNWQLNGETVIIGETGRTHSGQHRLTGVILADQEWRANPEEWPNWTTPPTLTTVIVFGIKEDDKVVNTIDTGKPRSLADVIYRSAHFGSMPAKDRRNVARMAEYALRLLGERTGAWRDAYCPSKITHADYLELLGNHPRLVQAVKHIYDENGSDNAVGKFFPLGSAAGLLYLMGCSGSDTDKYKETPTESSLTWQHWSKACDFWVTISNSDSIKIVRHTIAEMVEAGTDSPRARIGVIVKAWNQFLAGNPITPRSLVLNYVTEGEIKTLADFPTVGGIDLGVSVEEDPDDESGIVEEQIEQEKAKLRAEKAAKVEPKPEPAKPAPTVARPTTKKKAAKSPIPIGSIVYISEPGKDTWSARLLSIMTGSGNGKNAQCRVKVEPGNQGAGQEKMIPLAAVRTSQLQPESVG